ncbi:hypothetical protein B0H14DRAFT_1491037 [Mycena olivaceomarginata]|nr:hypothetical protein B0H14DRAFT_1491037 [Mycena olivaceomarginata]
MVLDGDDVFFHCDWPYAFAQYLRTVMGPASHTYQHCCRPGRRLRSFHLLWAYFRQPTLVILPFIMSLERDTPSPRETDTLDLPLMSGSAAQDWLANMILTVKTIAAGAEFIPVPYIRGAFGTVVILLETVDKMKKNRDDLLDLCESIVEIVRLLQAEVSAHGNVTGVRLMPLCEDFISFLCMLQIQLEKGMRNQVGFRGRFKAFLRATTVADHLVRYRNRINELRSNFLLVATIDTNLNVARIQQSVTPSREIPPIQQFRHVALGEINLLYETAMSSKAHKVKVFTARISGESSLMTVAKYEDELDRWKSDLELYSRLRHPNVWQLFGFAAAPGLHALIYHDELIPLSIYRQFHRPSSDLVWVCIEGMLFHQFRDSSQHHCWSTDAKIEKNLEPTLCVKRKPVQLCLTMPLLGNDSEDDDDEHRLSLWHTRLFKDHNPTADSRAVLNILTASPPDATLSSTLARNIDWKHLFATLIPVRFSREIPWQMRTQLFLGSVIAHRCDGFIPVAYIPNSSCVFIRPWELRVLPTVRPDREINSAFKLNRFTFLPGSFKAKKQPESDILLSCSITLEEDAVNALNMSWLSQANSCISEFSPNVRKSHR